jgi:hypothetical protein
MFRFLKKGFSRLMQMEVIFWVVMLLIAGVTYLIRTFS